MNAATLTIISGGQTGVDRAALDAALALGFPCGGWCRAGRLDEEGVIPAHDPLKELKKGGYEQRTIQNRDDADGTLILYFGTLEGGTEETAYRCMKLGKPYKLIDGNEVTAGRASELAAAWVRARAIRLLNVAGSRASKRPEAYPCALAVVTGLLRALG